MKSQIDKVTPFIIGLTGAIGTGKSLVRKMLEHKGALTIDADQLAHAAYIKGTAAFDSIHHRFGNKILDEAGQIDRKHLGDLVFKNPQVLMELEKLIHPLVTRAVNRLLGLSLLPIIVVEAIKLLESDLKDQCDVVWAVSSSADIIYQRLGATRGMDRAQVDDRLEKQPIKNIDETQIDTIILNNGNISELWSVVSAEWNTLSKKSNCFSDALTATREILQPFQKYLIQPEDLIHAEVFKEISKNGLVFLPAKYLSTNNLRSLYTAGFDSTSLEKTLYHYYLWGSGKTLEKNQSLISDMDNFTASAAASGSQFDVDQFSEIIGKAQDYFRLHLCEKMFISFGKENTPLIDEFGFYKCITDAMPTADISPLGYNLLCKQLMSPLDLFREK
jgi:dephospho-CoA kinase